MLREGYRECADGVAVCTGDGVRTSRYSDVRSSAVVISLFAAMVCLVDLTGAADLSGEATCMQVTPAGRRLRDMVKRADSEWTVLQYADAAANKFSNCCETIV